MNDAKELSELLSTPTQRQRSALRFSEFLTCLLEALAAEGVRCCILRNYEGFPENNVGRDLDFLIHPSQLSRTIRAAGSIQGTRIVGYAERPCVADVFLAGVSPVPESRTLQVDFDLSLTWKGLPYLSTEAVLESAIPRMFGSLSILTPSPAHEAIISLLASLLAGGLVKEKYFSKVQRAFDENKPEVIAALAPRFGIRATTQLVDSVVGGDRPKILGCAGTLRISLALRSLLRRPFSSILAVAQHYASGLAAHYSPKLLESICILGADGCGKTAIVENLIAMLQSSATVVEQHDPGPRLQGTNESSSGSMRASLRRGLPSGSFVSVARLVRWLLEEWVSQIKGRSSLTLRIFESRCHDLFINPCRYGYHGPMWLARIVCKLFPSPDLWILLDAPAKEIQSRNPRPSSAETQRQIEAYRAFVKTRKRCVILNDGKPLDNVTDDAYAAVTEMLVARAEGALKRHFQSS